MKKEEINYTKMVSLFGFVVHKSFSLNLIIYSVLNLVIIAATLGLVSMMADALEATITAFIMWIITVSLFDYLFSLIIYRLLPKLIFYTAGIILVVQLALSMYVTSLIVPNFEFINRIWLNVAIIAIIVFVVRWILSIYLRSLLYKEKETKG